MKFNLTFEKRDIWVGVYWEGTPVKYDVWICPLPCVCLQVTIKRAIRVKTDRERSMELTRELRDKQEGRRSSQQDRYAIHCEKCGVVQTTNFASMALLHCLSREPCYICHTTTLSLRYVETNERVTGPFTRTQRNVK